MDGLTVLSLCVTAALTIYLVVALLIPETFS